MSDDAVVLLDRPAPHVARLRINRPDKRNAIDHRVRQGLIDHLKTLLGDGQTRALVFGGVGGVFSAGGDLPSMAGLDEAQARERMRHIHVLCRLVAHAPIPVVSAMEGVTAGAAVGLALLGDRIVVGRHARVLFPFLRLGLVPDWGQLLTLPRRVGLPVAQRLLCDGAAIGGEEAVRIGLADEICDDREVMARAVALAARLAQLPAGAFGRMKVRLRHPPATLEQALRHEEDDQAICLTSDDFQEGFDAFMHKREADFIVRPGVKR